MNQKMKDALLQMYRNLNEAKRDKLNAVSMIRASGAK